MNTFKCPECETVYEISKLEMWELYEDNKETEFDCLFCGKDLIITSTATEWNFDVEINE